MAYDGDNAVIAGEVKRTERDIDTLVSLLVEFSRPGFRGTIPKRDKAFNGFQKWKALIDGRILFFWARVMARRITRKGMPTCDLP
jgi:hypothetical protein